LEFSLKRNLKEYPGDYFPMTPKIKESESSLQIQGRDNYPDLSTGVVFP
jgi:hypothetical protein